MIRHLEWKKKSVSLARANIYNHVFYLELFKKDKYPCEFLVSIKWAWCKKL